MYCRRTGIYFFKIGSVCLCAHLTLYRAKDCAAATDISGVSGRWQLSRYSVCIDWAGRPISLPISDSAAHAPGRTVVYIGWARQMNRLAPRACSSGAPDSFEPDLPVRRKTSYCCGVFGRCRHRKPKSREARFWLVFSKSDRWIHDRLTL